MLPVLNGIDIFLLLVIFLSVWSGISKGFSLGMIDFIKWIGSFILAFAGYKYIAELFEKLRIELGVWLLPLSFLIVFIIVSLLLSLIANYLYRYVSPELHHSRTNKVMGAIPGFLTGMVYVIILVALLLSMPLFDGLSVHARESAIASRLSDKVSWIDSKVSPVFDEAVKRTMTRITVEPGSEKAVKLHYTVTDPKVRQDLEERMLQLVNEERAKVNLTALEADPEMTMVARAHSKDMFARGYFSHYTPEGKDPFDRMKAAGVTFMAAGENLALGQTLQICHTGLMNSPGHRANILRPAFGRLGIGILDGGMYGLMISQEFRN